jgi:response regulator RpfG family c-di-GMP phosphodiesterase
MASFIDRVLAERRTLEQALADIRAKHDREPDPDLVNMIRHGEAELLDRMNFRRWAEAPAQP